MLDLSDTIQPKSDQLNADDLLAGPLDVTVASVRRVADDQPVLVHLHETDRPWKPCKTVRRVLVALWGADGEAWVGRRARLFNDPRVTWGGQRVGGIRVSHLSHIDGRKVVLVSVKRGKREPVTIEPMPEAPKPAPSVTLEEAVEARGLTLEALDAWAAEQGKPAPSSLEGEARARAAAWLVSPAADAVVVALR